VPDHRRALNARLAGLGVVALVIVLACSGLGVWQWQRGNVVVTEPPGAQPVVAVQDVVDAGADGARAVLSADEVGRRVEVTGRYDPAVDLLVPGREVGGTVGAWALGVVRLADGSGVPVVRGWVPAGRPAPGLPGGAVVLTGTLQPPESSDVAPSTAALPEGQTWIVSAADLVNRVDYPVANAYVTDAAQWWVFALFAVVVWVRVVRDERSDAGDDDAGDGSDDEQVEGPGGRDMSGAR
jgi:surfeit locus 1 family protein